MKNDKTMTNQGILALDPSNPQDIGRLWDQYKGLAHMLVYRYLEEHPYVSHQERDDMEQEAYLALYDTLRLWRPSDAAFSTAYGWQINARITKLLRKNKTEPLDMAISLDAVMDDGAPLYNFIPNDVDLKADTIRTHTRQADAERAHRAMATLSAYDQEILHLRYLDGKSPAEIGHILGDDTPNYTLRQAKRHFAVTLVATGGMPS